MNPTQEHFHGLSFSQYAPSLIHPPVSLQGNHYQEFYNFFA